LDRHRCDSDRGHHRHQHLCGAVRPSAHEGRNRALVQQRRPLWRHRDRPRLDAPEQHPELRAGHGVAEIRPVGRLQAELGEPAYADVPSGWYPDYFDSDDYASPFLSIAGAKSLGSFYNNSQVDQWITEEQSTTDPNIRTDRFTKIQNALADDVPYIPLFSGVAQTAYVNSVQNVELHPVVFKW